jgi:hypothetical protein
MLGNSWVAAQLAASQEELSSMELLSSMAETAGSAHSQIPFQRERCLPRPNFKLDQPSQNIVEINNTKFPRADGKVLFVFDILKRSYLHYCVIRLGYCPLIITIWTKDHEKSYFTWNKKKGINITFCSGRSLDSPTLSWGLWVVIYISARDTPELTG